MYYISGVPVLVPAEVDSFAHKKDQLEEAGLSDLSCSVLTNQTQSNLCIINVDTIAEGITRYSPKELPPAIRIAPINRVNKHIKAKG